MIEAELGVWAVHFRGRFFQSPASAQVPLTASPHLTRSSFPAVGSYKPMRWDTTSADSTAQRLIDPQTPGLTFVMWVPAVFSIIQSCFLHSRNSAWTRCF